MPFYQRLGTVPRKRHIQFRDNGTLLTEEVMGLEGFVGNESILYHLQSPCRVMNLGDFDDIELPDGLTFMVTEKGEGGAESDSEGRAHFCRVRTDDGELTVVDLQVLLQFDEAPHLARAFRSPIAPVEAHDQWKATRQFG